MYDDFDDYDASFDFQGATDYAAERALQDDPEWQAEYEEWLDSQADDMPEPMEYDDYYAGEPNPMEFDSPF